MEPLTPAEVYEKHADDLVRFATGLVGPDDAADVVSSAVLRAVGSSAWSRARDHRAYLFGAVLNETRMHHRSTLRRRAREVRAAQLAGNRGDEPPTPRPEVLEQVAQLSVRQRAVVYLTYWEDLDRATTGALLGISEGAVKRHLARAHHRLRETITDD